MSGKELRIWLLYFINILVIAIIIVAEISKKEPLFQEATTLQEDSKDEQIILWKL